MPGLKLKEIGIILLLGYTIFWLSISHYLTSQLSEFENVVDAIVNIKPKSRSETGGDEMEHLNSHDNTNTNAAAARLTLTAHLYINGTDHTPIAFPQTTQEGQQTETATSTSTNTSTGRIAIAPFPVIDEYPAGDPYLPWIHDIFPSHDHSRITILAQNRRRCHTGNGMVDVMKEQEPQIALFQPISLHYNASHDNNVGGGGGGSVAEKEKKITSMKVSNLEDATVHETRFLCRFKKYHKKTGKIIIDDNDNAYDDLITYSVYSYNYEHIAWRKGMNGMYETKGKDMAQFWLSSLEFNCPVPPSLQQMQRKKISTNVDVDVYLDIATIRTPVRRPGQTFLKELEDGIFDVYKFWGEDMYIQAVEDSTRWENIHIPSLSSGSASDRPRGGSEVSSNGVGDGESISSISSDMDSKKPYKLVACTWSSAAHNRRGDAVTLKDGRKRLKEWIAYNLLVGFDHVVVYDNSGANTQTETLKDVTDLFPEEYVTHVPWPCKICNNNRPAHDDPGERSSQYAAEASCRSRFGPQTDWMTFLDPDEYLVPVGKYDSWKDILTKLDEEEERKILKFRSTRARPRQDLMVDSFDPSHYRCPSKDEVALGKPGVSSCLVPREDKTFLQTYNCEYIKSPKPDRFQRAMKQLYRPDYVLSHFVHYSTVTTELAIRKEDFGDGHYRVGSGATTNKLHERFVDEINEGVLIHAKTMVPNEAVKRKARCLYKMTMCSVGIECPDDLPFSDSTHTDGFLYDRDKYCNCWVNRKVEEVWIPKLETALARLD